MRARTDASPLHFTVPVACALICAVAIQAAGRTAGAAQEPATQARPARQSYPTNYHLHYLDAHAAEILAWEQCPDKDCRVSTEGNNLQVVGTGEVHERVSRALARLDAEPRTQVFQLTLLVAEMSGGGAAAPDLAPGARKALEDIQTFLPYKSYRVVDRVLLRSTRGADGRLVGEQGQRFRVHLSFSPTGLPEAKKLLVDSFSLDADAQPPAAVAPAASPASVREPAQPGDPGGSLIHTSFGMAVGETVVVGTSKLAHRDQALVVLLTAVP
jgi:hypothetical protein